MSRNFRAARRLRPTDCRAPRNRRLKIRSREASAAVGDDRREDLPTTSGTRAIATSVVATMSMSQQRLEPTCDKAPPLLRDFVIASPKELDETESMAERISHKSELAPLVCSDGLF